jgi:signal peptidase II
MIFNVADACITLGVLLLVARALLLGEKAGQADAKPPVN